MHTFKFNKAKPTSGVETSSLLGYAIQFSSDTVIEQSSNEHQLMLYWVKRDKRTYHRVHFRDCNDIFSIIRQGQARI